MISRLKYKVKNLKKLAIFIIIALIIILAGIFIFSPQPIIAPDNNKKEANIIVESPQPGSSQYPISLKGKARVFENTVSYRLIDEQKNILNEGFVMADAPDVGQFGDFTKKIYYPETKSKNGILQVFQFSAKDGSEIDMVSIPVIFSSFDDGPKLKIYFSNKNQDPQGLNCQQTYPVIRKIPKGVSTVDAALNLLLNGPLKEEINQGYFTSLPENINVKLISLDNKTGKLTVDFDQSLMAGVGGSCRVAAMKSQLINTLTQFNNVKQAIITINGQTEGVFEP
jgi:hypothetical protein